MRTKFSDNPGFDWFFGVARCFGDKFKVVGFYQRYRSAFGASTAGTSNSVNINVGLTWHIEVNNMANFRYINASRGYVGS